MLLAAKVSTSDYVCVTWFCTLKPWPTIIICLLRHEGSTVKNTNIQKNTRTHDKKNLHNKRNYKYALSEATKACVTAFFILSLVEVGLTS